MLSPSIKTHKTYRPIDYEHTKELAKCTVRLSKFMIFFIFSRFVDELAKCMGQA